MTRALDIAVLRQVVSGYAAAFRSITVLQPAGGQGDKVFPPTYSGGQYAVEKRRLPGRDDPVDCVLLDSVQSQANRLEECLLEAARAGVQLRSQPEVRAPLRVPSAVMRQVMLNLLVNAVNAAGEDGWVNAVLEADEKAVRFTVSNTGARLGSEGLQRIVAAESGDNPRGFGLWVCREIATQFGGGLSIVENEAAATTLRFWIPNRERDEIAVVA